MLYEIKDDLTFITPEFETTHLYKVLKDFFESDKVVKYLNNNDFLRLFAEARDWLGDGNINLVTSLLIQADIDFLKYMDAIVDNMFHSFPITSIVIPNSIKSIEVEGFEGCSELKEITIPETCTYIATAAFDGCYRLNTINYGGTKQQWRELVKNNYSIPAHATIFCKDGAL